MRFRLTTYLLLTVALSLLLNGGCASKPERTAIGKQILSDETLFPTINGRGISKLADDFMKGPNHYDNFSMRVDGPSPTMEVIRAKYGQPDREKEMNVGPYPVKTYFYGVIGFGVAESDGRVERIVIGRE